MIFVMMAMLGDDVFRDFFIANDVYWWSFWRRIVFDLTGIAFCG